MGVVLIVVIPAVVCCLLLTLTKGLQCYCPQCFDGVGWAAGRASGL